MNDPCTIAINMEETYRAIHDSWIDEESIEEFITDEQMNVQCDEFAQENYTV